MEHCASERIAAHWQTSIGIAVVHVDPNRTPPSDPNRTHLLYYKRTALVSFRERRSWIAKCLRYRDLFTDEQADKPLA